MARSVSRSQILGCLVLGALVVASTPALAAKKKKATDSPDEPAPATTAASTAEKKPAEGASQSADQERPKPVLDENQEAPATDEKGNVAFSGARTGKGKIIVKGAAKENVKIYLEGRYVGTAPRTINGMPPGDYIVEGVFPDGRSVTKPVSVAGEEEVVVEMAPSDATDTGAKTKLMPMAQAERRWTTAKVVGIASVAVLAAGGVMGYLTHTTQQDYDKAAINGTQGQLDDLAKKGNRYSLLANIGFVAGGIGLVTAAFIGYPAYKARNADRRPDSPDTAPISFLFGPTPRLDGGAASLRFAF